MRQVEMSKSLRTTFYQMDKREQFEDREVYIDGRYEGRVEEFRDVAFVQYATDFIGPLQKYQRRKTAEFKLCFRSKPKKYHLRVNKNKNVLFSDIESVEAEVKRTFPNARKYEIKG